MEENGALELVRHMADRLTGEELQVMELLARGLTRAEVAEQLFLSEDQVHGIVQRALNCLGARRTITAVVWLTQLGLINPTKELGENPHKLP